MNRATAPFPRADRAPGAMELLGIGVHPMGSAEILDYAGEVIRGGKRALVLHLNVHGANLASRHPWLKQLYNEAQLVFCDGDGVRWGLRLNGFSAPPKVTYNVWIWHLARWAEANEFSVFLLGSRPGVAERAMENLRAKHPRLSFAGMHHGYFDRGGSDNEAVIAKINHARPDVLLVCLGMPVQEEWVRDYSERLATHVILTGGAALDYAAGVLPVTPPWIARLQMEWFYRLACEPRRLFRRYVIGNPLFAARAIVDSVRRSRSRGARSHRETLAR